MAKLAAVVSVLTLVTSWNNFLLPLVVLIRDQSWWTLPLGVMQFQGQYGSDWPRILAYLTLSILPTIAFFLLFQKGGPLSAVPAILAGGAAIMAVAGILFFREPPSWQRLLGVGFAIIGLFLLRK